MNGKFYVRLKPLKALNKYEALALVLHEGVPGHHLDRVVSKSRKNLPFLLKILSVNQALSIQGERNKTSQPKWRFLYTKFQSKNFKKFQDFEIVLLELWPIAD